MSISLTPLDKVEIVTLEDNYVDLVAQDGNEVIARAMPLKGMELSNSILAEHGFSSMIRLTLDGRMRSLLFDFGLSADVAARNAEAIGADLSGVEAAALSHGHMDHFGGLEALSAAVGKTGLPLILHPGVFKKARFVEPMPGFKISMPVLTRERAREAGFQVVETVEPMAMLDGWALFLGEVPRKTGFENGMPNAFYENEDGEAVKDDLVDDSALVFEVRDKGLVILTGCAHSGVVNTVVRAREVTGNSRVFAVMGGFHLSGPAFAPALDPTLEALKEVNPAYVVPTHCTGRDSTARFEKAFGDAFVLNMSGTTLTFSS